MLLTPQTQYYIMKVCLIYFSQTDLWKKNLLKVQPSKALVSSNILKCSFSITVHFQWMLLEYIKDINVLKKVHYKRPGYKKPSQTTTMLHYLKQVITELYNDRKTSLHNNIYFFLGRWLTVALCIKDFLSTHCTNTLFISTSLTEVGSSLVNFCSTDPTLHKFSLEKMKYRIITKIFLIIIYCLLFHCQCIIILLWHLLSSQFLQSLHYL